MQLVKFTNKNMPLASIWPDSLVKLQECPLCSSGNCKLKFITCRLDGLKLFECLNCGLSFVNPKPTLEAIVAYYDSDYFTGNKDFHYGRNYLEESNKRYIEESQTGFNDLINNINITGKRILEIGCGTGVLLALCKKYGADYVKGYDLSKEAIEYGRYLFDIDLVCDRFEDGINNQTYDVIIMIDVIEHIYDIRIFFSNLKKLLNTNGIIYILTPNWQGYSYSKCKWSPLSKDYEHLQYFGTKSLDFITNLIGSKCILTYTDGYPFHLRQYRLNSGRLLNIASNPSTAIFNVMAKLKFNINNRLKNQSLGHNLHYFIRYEDPSLLT